MDKGRKRFKLCTECGKKATALPQEGVQMCTFCHRSMEIREAILEARREQEANTLVMPWRLP